MFLWVIGLEVERKLVHRQRFYKKLTKYFIIKQNHLNQFSFFFLNSNLFICRGGTTVWVAAPAKFTRVMSIDQRILFCPHKWVNSITVKIYPIVASNSSV